MPTYELIGSLQTGSAIVEMGFALAGLPVDLTDVPYLEAGPGRDRLLSMNPLGQVPTLVLPDGTVMTESAAILLHLDEAVPDAGLLPSLRSPRRAGALNDLILFVAAIYPTSTFGDTPEDFTLPGEAAARLRETTDERRCELWRRVEQRISPAPFWLGAQVSALDLYVAVMVNWRPGLSWFEANAPKLVSIANEVRREPALSPIMRRHFAE